MLVDARRGATGDNKHVELLQRGGGELGGAHNRGGVLRAWLACMWRGAPSLPHNHPLLCSRCVPALLMLTGARASGDSTWSWVESSVQYACQRDAPFIIHF